MTVQEFKQVVQYIENELSLNVEPLIIFPDNDTNKMRFALRISVSFIYRKLAEKLLSFNSFIKIEIETPEEGNIFLLAHFRAE